MAAKKVAQTVIKEDKFYTISAANGKVVEVAELVGYEKEEYVLHYLYQTENEKLVRTDEKLVHQEKLLRYREMKERARDGSHPRKIRNEL